MKRNSRILAIILTLCLLCCAVVTTVFASTGIDISTIVANQLKPAGATNYSTTSFSMGSYSTGNSTVNKNAVDAKGNPIVNVYNTGSVQNNTAVSFLNIPAGDTTSSATGANYSLIKNGAVQYNYFVYDFDFGTDKYAVQVGYYLRTTTTSVTSADKKTTTVTYAYDIMPAYKTYTPAELTEENVKADIAETVATLNKLKEDSDFGHEFVSQVITTKDSSGKSTTVTNYSSMYNYDLGFDDMEQYDWDYEKAMATKQLALASGDRVYVQGRYWKNATASYSSFSAGLYWRKDSTGNWFFSSSAGGNKLAEMSDTPGVYDHITIVIETVAPAEGSTTGTFNYHFFVNGEYVYSPTSTNSIYSGGVESIRLTLSANLKTTDAYSYAVANTTTNYYSADSSGDAYGIYDLFSGADYKTTSLTDCSDVVYTKDYISPNGYLYVKNGYSVGNPVSNSEKVAAELAKIKDGSIVYTTMDITNLDVPAGVEEFNIICDKDLVNVTLSSASTSAGYALRETENGYKVFIDRSDMTVYVKWLDIKGNHITTTTLLHGNAPDASGIVANYFDNETSTIYHATVSGWTWSLDGDVRAVTPDMLPAGETVVMTPVISGSITEVTDVTFYMGVRYDDTLVTAPAPASDGTYTKYKNAAAATVMAESIAMKYGNTCVLASDFTGDKAAASGSAQTLPKNKVFNFDLNGHVFVRDGISNSFGYAIFNLAEGGTANIYSTRTGGKVVMGNIRNDSSPNLICSSGGIINVTSKIDKGTVNIGDILDEKGNVISKCGNNFTYIGGTMVLVPGAVDTPDYNAFDTLKNENKITININGGFYYSPYRASYALIITQAPDTVVNADGITFLSTYYSAASFFHDYESGTITDTKDYDGDKNTTEKLTYPFATNSVVTVKNSKIYSMLAVKNSDGVNVATTAASIINRLDENSTVYFENSILVGKICGNLKGNIVLGAGNTIADLANLVGKTSKITYAPDVKVSTPKNYKYQATMAHPDTDSTWSSIAYVVKSGSTIDGALDTSAEVKLLSSAHISSTVWTNTKDIVYDVTLTCVTYDEKNIPDLLAKVNWNDADGNHISTTYELIGTTPAIPSDVENVVGTSIRKTWYVRHFSWTAPGTDFVVKAGENTFTPSPYVEAKITGIKMNATLFEDVKFNLYLPKDELVSNVSVSGAVLSDGFATIEGKQYYVISASLDIDEFDPISATVSYTAEGETLSYPLTLDLISYATVVSERYTCGSEEATLVYEMLSYKDTVAESVSKDYVKSASLNTFMTTHKDCSCAIAEPEISDSELNVNYTAIKDKGVTGIAYSLTLGEIGMVVFVNDGVVVDSVSYTDDFGRVMTHTVANGNLTKRNGYYLVSGVSAAYIDNVMTITVDGETGTYSLGKYITNQPGVVTAKSLYKYATAAEDYKYTTEAENDKAIYSGMKSVLLIGQSNMVGQNDLSVVDPIQDDRLFMMKNDSWVPMQEPLHGGNYGAGIGASFGKAFVETFDVDLGLIPAARGATTLEMWAVGGDLYNEAIRKAKLAQETSEIVAILWHQGEGNQNDTQYAEKLKVIFDAMLAELGLDPDKIVIVTGEMYGTRSDAVHMPELEDLGENYKNYGIALSDGLTTVDPQTHFDAPSMRVFGYRYFDIFYNFITGKHYYFNQDQNAYLKPDIG